MHLVQQENHLEVEEVMLLRAHQVEVQKEVHLVQKEVQENNSKKTRLENTNLVFF